VAEIAADLSNPILACKNLIRINFISEKKATPYFVKASATKKNVLQHRRLTFL